VMNAFTSELNLLKGNQRRKRSGAWWSRGGMDRGVAGGRRGCGSCKVDNERVRPV
jgi:hypothetical protein